MSHADPGLLRTVLDALSTRRKARRRCLRRAEQARRDARTVARYLEESVVPRLQLGTGPNPLAGWLNSDLNPQRDDVIRLDASAPFPFADRTFDFVFSEHLVEHLDRDAGDAMLRECHRVLRPGRVLRVATPDLARLIALHAGRDEATQSYVGMAMDRHFPTVRFGDRATVINHMFRAWGHQFIYDEETLRAALAAVGFGDCARCEPGESRHEMLRDLEAHGDVVGIPMNRYETMVLEATKPADDG
jgi:predicted SAM-dependent methyltransferase